MNKSIQYFCDHSIKAFENIQTDFCKDPKDFSSFMQRLTDELQILGQQIIKETLEEMNQMLLDSAKRKSEWKVEKHTGKQLITSIGTVEFRKTLFTNKKTGEMSYLLDRILGLAPHERITEDAQVRMLTEAVQSSYRRGGEASCLPSMEKVSKETVKERLHSLKFQRKAWKKPEVKKAVEYLYVEADEDHVALQFKEKKGDLTVNEAGNKNNSLISRLIYVHEGVEPEAPKSSRYHLIAPYYFARVCSNAKENEELWDEVYCYICDHYEVEKIKRIYLSSDGGGWIKAGMKRIKGLTFVLDEFHLAKYMTRLTSHIGDSRDDAQRCLRAAIRRGTKQDFNEVVDRLKEYLPDTIGEKRIEEARTYFLENWSGAKLRLRHRDGVIGCSAEGHVSHLLSGRLSSRPMGWSKTGAAKMTELRAYCQNGGSILKLVRYQKQELPLAAGEENPCISAEEMLRAERKMGHTDGKYFDAIRASISSQTAKQVFFNTNIWRL